MALLPSGAFVVEIIVDDPVSIVCIASRPDFTAQRGHVRPPVSLQKLYLRAVETTVNGHAVFHDEGNVAVIASSGLVSARSHPYFGDARAGAVQGTLQAGVGIGPGRTVVGASGVGLYINDITRRAADVALVSLVVAVVVCAVADFSGERIDGLVAVVAVGAIWNIPCTTGVAKYLTHCQVAEAVIIAVPVASDERRRTLKFIGPYIYCSVIIEAGIAVEIGGGT